MKTPDGIQYRVRHVREPDFRYVLSDAVDETLPPSPKGGYTVVEIIEPFDLAHDPRPDYVVLATGIARCSPRDNYNRKLGRTIALGRALKTL